MALLRKFSCRAGFLLSLALLCCSSKMSAQTQSPTATTLSITAAGTSATSVTTNTAITLTATVTSAGKAAAPGLVDFCNDAAFCSGSNKLATVPVNTNGTATYAFVPGPGTHAYKAQFQATTQYGSSSSATASISVSGKVNSAITVIASGTRGDSTLTATVVGTASQAPTGTVSFSDQTEKNAVLGIASLTANPAGFAFAVTGSNAGWPATAVADVNGDGIPDVIYAFNGMPAYVSQPVRAPGSALNPSIRSDLSPGSGPCYGGLVLNLGNGDGTFAWSNTGTGKVPCNPNFITTGDFNGDGFVDLVISNDRNALDSTNPTAGFVLLGDGKGNFSPTPAVSPYDIPDGQTFAVDVNGDGKLDLVTSQAAVFLGDGNGGFTYGGGILNDAFTGIASDAVGDFNGDGIPDLATIVYREAMDTPRIIIYLGVGDGTFVPSPASPIDLADTGQIFTADFNSDGKPDLAVTVDQSVQVFINDGRGSFNAPSTYQVDAEAGLAIGDFNYDGYADLAAFPSAYKAQTSQILLGDGAGKFTPQTIAYGFPQAQGLKAPIIATDLNGDGIADLVGSNSYIALVGSQSAAATINSISPSPAGSDFHQVSASYGGDAAYFPSTSVPVSVQSAAGTPQVVLTSSANPVAAGYPVTLTAAVAGLGAVATGTVNFYRGVTPLGSGTLANGTATLTLNAPATGSYTITATYVGDSNYNQAASAPLTLTTFVAYTPKVVVAASPSTAVYGSTVTLSSTVSGTSGTPTGKVTFMQGATALGTATLDATGSASLTTSGRTSLPAGTDVITASYSGDTQYAAAVSAAQSVVITQAQPTLSIMTTDVAFQVPFNVSYTFTYAGVFPTGTVTLYIDGSAFPTQPVGSNYGFGNGLAPGAHSVYLTYSGDNNYLTATSPTATMTVGRDKSDYIFFTQTSLTSVYGSPVTLSAKVNASNLPEPPTGTVTYTSGKLVLGTAPLLSTTSGQAPLTTTLLPVGTNPIVATYSGDNNYASVASGPNGATVTVSKADLTGAVTASPATAALGAPVTIATTLTYKGGAPTGKVLLVLDSSNPSAAFASITPVNGVATYTYSKIPLGTHGVVAYFAGDSNYNAAYVPSSADVTILPVATITPAPANTTSYVGADDVVTITLATPAGGKTPTGTITLSGSGYTSAATALVNGSVSITIPANSLSVGNDTLTAAYSGDSVYGASSSSFQINVTNTPPSVTLAPAANSLTLSSGATTGNTDTITVTPQEGLTGSVKLAAAIASGPAGGVDPPTFTFNPSSPLSIDGKSAANATLTINTTATTTASIRPAAQSSLYAAGATILACLGLIGIPGRRRRLRGLLVIVLSLAVYAGLTACGGSSSGSSGGGTGPKGSPGTTPGTYQIKVTATEVSGNNSSEVLLNTTTITLTIK